MRYFFQLVVMLSDFVVIGAVYIVWTVDPVLGLLCAFGAWYVAKTSHGGLFYAWRPSSIKAFLTNAKKAGL